MYLINEQPRLLNSELLLPPACTFLFLDEQGRNLLMIMQPRLFHSVRLLDSLRVRMVETC